MPTPKTHKTCAMCLTKLPVSDFPPHRGHKDGRESVCRPCARERTKLAMRKFRSTPAGLQRSRELNREAYYRAKTRIVRSGDARE